MSSFKEVEPQIGRDKYITEYCPPKINKREIIKFETDGNESDNLRHMYNFLYDSFGEKTNCIGHKELVLGPDAYRMVLKTCFLQPIPISISIYYEMYLCTLMGVVILFTSLNYWRYPLKSSYRRTIDIISVNSIVPYQLYLSFYTNCMLSALIIVIGILMYPVSNYFQSNYKYVKLSAFFHCLMHILIGIGVSIMYKSYYERFLYTTNNTILNEYSVDSSVEYSVDSSVELLTC